MNLIRAISSFVDLVRNLLVLPTHEWHPSFRDLFNQAKKFGLMLQAMEGPPVAAAFSVDRSFSNCRELSHARGPCSNQQQRNRRNDRRPPQSNGGSRDSSASGRKTYIPCCQICKGVHYDDKCLGTLRLVVHLLLLQTWRIPFTPHAISPL